MAEQQARLQASAKGGVVGGQEGLEGFGRQMIHEDLLRYAIGFGIGALWMIYLYLPRRARAD